LLRRRTSPCHAAAGGPDHERSEGGGIAMKGLEAKSPAPLAQEFAASVVMTRLPSCVDSSGRIVFLGLRRTAPVDAGCRSWRVAPETENWGCGQCPHPGFGPGRTGVGSGRIPYVSGGSQCLQGLECSSSPTSGTCFPSSEACGPLSVDRSPFMGPFGGPFCWWPLLWPGASRARGGRRSWFAAC
jgi:hypothetical protein